MSRQPGQQWRQAEGSLLSEKAVYLNPAGTGLQHRPHIGAAADAAHRDQLCRTSCVWMQVL